jgi:dolichol kinase
MKRLYLHYLNLRVWLLRRRLRQMAFRENAGKMNEAALLRFHLEAASVQWLIIEGIKIALMAIAIACMWLIFFLLLLEPIQIDLPSIESLPSLPALSAPVERSYEIHQDTRSAA